MPPDPLDPIDPVDPLDPPGIELPLLGAMGADDRTGHPSLGRLGIASGLNRFFGTARQADQHKSRPRLSGLMWRNSVRLYDVLLLVEV